MSKCTTRDILDALNHDELNALRRRAEWCDREWEPSRTDLLDGMNSTVTGLITHGTLTPKQLVEDINNLVGKQGPNRIDTQIQTILGETPITKFAGWKSETEGIACAHLTGVLQGQLGHRFDIIQEKTFDNRFLDIYMRDADTEDEYLVEAKVNTRFSKEALKNQLRDYHELLDNRRETYVVFVVFGKEKYELEMQDKRSQINEFLGEDEAEFIETIDDNVEIVLNLNPPQ